MMKLAIPILALVLVAAGGVLVLTDRDGSAATDVRPLTRAPVEQAAADAFEAGLEHFRKERYEDAIPFFERALAEPSLRVRALQYLEGSRREAEVAPILERATAALQAFDLDGAQAALADPIPPESLQTRRAEELSDDIATLRGALEEAEQGYVTRALELVSEKPLRVADATSANGMLVLAALEEEASFLESLEAARERGKARHEHRELWKLSTARVENMLAFREQLPASVVDEVSAVATRLATWSEWVEDLEVTSPGCLGPLVTPSDRKAMDILDKARNAFDRGDLKSTRTLFRKVVRGHSPRFSREAEKLRGSLEEWEAAEKQRKSPRRQTRRLEATERSAKAAKAISPFGRVHRRLASEVAEIRYALGREAFEEERYELAYRQWRSADRLGVDTPRIEQGLRDLQAKAKELYLQGYTTEQEDRMAAARLYQRVIKMTPPEFEYHAKASKRLEMFGG